MQKLPLALPSLAKAAVTLTPREVVMRFFAEVRSGLYPERAGAWMAERVLAHQVQAEAPLTVARSPAEYAEHVREMWAEHGPFELDIEEVLADGDKVYVRWRQSGWLREAAGTRPLSERASAVYRVEDGKIAAYHIQIDRLGIVLQQEAGQDQGRT